MALILVAGVVLIFRRWNDYREKEMVAVLDTEEIEEFIFLQANTENAVLFEQRAVEDPDEQFSFQINYQDERISIPSMIERDVLLFDMDQFTITNGPLDYGWIESFLEEHNLD
ncbi:hypothetical protein DHX103_10925 [Planococcus sp. X10-3]|uniref:hypothetical protein n=1 Tax=Planococcus sp. X10-3 TaxID=3061240 RepID=UPI003BB0DA11